VTAGAFWTAADDAELDLLVAALVDGYHEHRERHGCSPLTCPHLAEAVEAVLAWKRWRTLTSAAAALRAEQDLADWTTEARARAATREEAA
jgi:hypothetical protein